jgi:butyryl-CoA dehydrogenase
MGILAVSQGLQCLGGYGYCEDFPLEQYYRDIRIHPIHEGTTGIQGMDLLGRKVVMKEGKALICFGQAVAGTVAQAKENPDLKTHAESLETAVKKLEEVTMHLVGVAQNKGPEAYLADAVVFLEFFSIIAISWQWLIQGVAATKGLQSKTSSGDKRFYTGKLYAFRYYFRYELPKIQGLAQRLTDGDPLTLEMPPECFND